MNESPERSDVEKLLDRSDPQNIRFVQAKNFTRAHRGRIDLIVIHAMQGAELADKAETVALWFAGKNANHPAPRASAHYAIDCDSVVQMVRNEDVAWHAPGANSNGIGIEHAGLAQQTREQWLDQFSKPMLAISAGLTARLCKAYGIPIAYLDADRLRENKRGITTHRAVNEAFLKSTHTDPGLNFPMDWYLQQVQTAARLV